MIASLDVIDVLLALCLTAAALFCLFDRHLVRACCCFGVFTLSMALAWLTLGAPWLAIVEGFIGALLTVPCFFYALGIFPANSPALPRYDHVKEPLARGMTRTLLALAWCVMVGSVIHFVLPAMVYSPLGHPLLFVGVVIVATAMGAFAWHRHLLRRLLAFNVLGSGVFLLLAGMAGTSVQGQALITIGLVVAWFGSLLSALLIRTLYLREGPAALLGASELQESEQ